MKHTILLVGGQGAKVAQALVWAACAGAWTADADLLLVDLPPRPRTDLAALLRDYTHVQALCRTGEGHFAPQLTLRFWPETLPEECITLRQWAASTGDDLLLRSLFDHRSADASAIRGFDQSPDAARAVMDTLLSAPGGPIEELASAEGKIIVCGSMASAFSSGAVTALCSRLQGCAAVALLPYTQSDSPAIAASALATIAAGGPDTVFTLGLSEGDAAACQAELPHLAEWQAVCCMQAYLQAESFTPGLYTWRLAPGPLQWASFGPEAAHIRRNWGTLIKTAALFTLHLAPGIRRAVNAPNWLRDRKLPWLSSYFGQLKQMSPEDKQTLLADLSALMRLLDAVCLWMEQLLHNLPPILSHATAVEAARRAAKDNYAQLMELTGRVETLRRSLTESSLSDAPVSRYGDEDVDAKAMETALAQLETARDQLRARHEELCHQLGGAGAMQVIKSVRRKLQHETRDLHDQAAEALRRIDEAQRLAQAEDMHRIATARTKLARLERYVAQLDLQVESAREDERKAAENRRVPAQIAFGDAPAENLLFRTDMLHNIRLSAIGEELSRQDKLLLQTLTDDWQDLLQPAGGPSAPDLLDSLTVPTQAAQPLAALLLDVMNACTKEVRA